MSRKNHEEPSGTPTAQIQQNQPKGDSGRKMFLIWGLAFLLFIIVAIWKSLG